MIELSEFDLGIDRYNPARIQAQYVGHIKLLRPGYYWDLEQRSSPKCSSISCPKASRSTTRYFSFEKTINSVLLNDSALLSGTREVLLLVSELAQFISEEI